MTAAITLWLAFALVAGTLSFFGTRRQAVAFAMVALATLPLSMVTLGRPAPWRPAAGHHTVLGARIDKDVAIYVMLDSGGEPRLYVLPYSVSAANQLQSALDGAADGEGGVAVEIEGDGSPGFSETHEAPEPVKVGEAQIIGG